MATTPAPTARDLMVSLTRSQSTHVLTDAWVTAVRQRETATGGQQQVLDTALDVMTAELRRRGVSQDTLDTLLWVVQMQATS